MYYVVGEEVGFTLSPQVERMAWRKKIEKLEMRISDVPQSWRFCCYATWVSTAPRRFWRDLGVAVSYLNGPFPIC